MTGAPDWPDGADPAQEDPDAEYVDDIGVLRRAEEAVAHDEPFPLGPPVDLDEERLPVASGSFDPAPDEVREWARDEARPPAKEGPARATGASPLSDNARLEGGEPRSGCGPALAFTLVVLLALAVVAYIVTRG